MARSSRVMLSRGRIYRQAALQACDRGHAFAPGRSARREFLFQDQSRKAREHGQPGLPFFPPVCAATAAFFLTRR